MGKFFKNDFISLQVYFCPEQKKEKFQRKKSNDRIGKFIIDAYTPEQLKFYGHDDSQMITE